MQSLVSNVAQSIQCKLRSPLLQENGVHNDIVDLASLAEVIDKPRDGEEVKCTEISILAT